MTPTYRSDRMLLYQGDVLGALKDDDMVRPTVVLTDAPWARWGYICDVESETVTVEVGNEGLWLEDVNHWLLLWLPVVRELRPVVGLFFANPHWAGLYLHLARYMKWPMVGWWSATETRAHAEYLLAFSDVLTPHQLDGSEMELALMANSYGQGKDVGMLRRIVRRAVTQIDPDIDVVVLDPFMGSGSTGRAALAEGCRFVGIELRAQTYRQAFVRLRDSEAKVA